MSKPTNSNLTRRLVGIISCGALVAATLGCNGVDDGCAQLAETIVACTGTQVDATAVNVCRIQGRDAQAEALASLTCSDLDRQLNAPSGKADLAILSACLILGTSFAMAYLSCSIPTSE